MNHNFRWVEMECIKWLITHSKKLKVPLKLNDNLTIVSLSMSLIATWCIVIAFISELINVNL